VKTRVCSRTMCINSILVVLENWENVIHRCRRMTTPTICNRFLLALLSRPALEYLYHYRFHVDTYSLFSSTLYNDFFNAKKSRRRLLFNVLVFSDNYIIPYYFIILILIFLLDYIIYYFLKNITKCLNI